jgi:hypothetical protein
MGYRKAGVLWLLLLSLMGCSEQETQSADSTSSDVVTAVLKAQIGAIEGAEEYLFGDITSVASDVEGRIYIADRIGSSVRVFDSTGAHLAWLGTEGEGPGEYQWPNDLAFDVNGHLVVRDANRLTVLGTSGDSGLPDSVVQTIRLPGYANLSSRRARAGEDLYYYPDYLLRRGEPERYFYLVFDSTAFTGDTVHVPPLETLQNSRSAFYMVSQGSGRMVYGLNRAPFEPYASWDITSDGHVLSTTGLDYGIVETDQGGDTIRMISGPGARRAVPPGEKEDSAAALQERLDSLPVPLDDVQGVSRQVREGTLPDSLPVTTALHVSNDGKIWVGRWPLEGAGAQAVFDVFTRSGEYERTVVVPADVLTDPPPFLSDRLIVGVVRDPVTEVESVLVFVLEDHGG